MKSAIEALARIAKKDEVDNEYRIKLASKKIKQRSYLYGGAAFILSTILQAPISEAMIYFAASGLVSLSESYIRGFITTEEKLHSWVKRNGNFYLLEDKISAEETTIERKLGRRIFPLYDPADLALAPLGFINGVSLESYDFEKSSNYGGFVLWYEGRFTLRRGDFTANFEYISMAEPIPTELQGFLAKENLKKKIDLLCETNSNSMIPFRTLIIWR